MNWRGQLKGTLLIFLFGGSWVMLWCDSCFQDPREFAIFFSYGGCFWTGLWKGSEIVVNQLDKVYTWLEEPIKRLVVSIIGVVVLTAVVVYGLDLFYDVVVFGKSFEEATAVLQSTSLLETTLVTLGINSFMHGRGFMFQWRQASIDMEKLRTEQVTMQYQSLKNQVNPHFLFNSLNVLSSLVYDDQDKAVDFIRRLSQVYRYVLDKKDEELVPTQDEIDFMESFIYLQQIRFDQNLQVELSYDKVTGYLPPLALQILVENAIKHNVISEKDPLVVKVSIENEMCIVENSVKEKLSKDSTGIGLDNLTARYGYLTDRKVEIEHTPERFVVKLPILKLDK